MIPEKHSKENIVSSVALEMKRSIVALAGPRTWNETREAWIARAARKARINYRQAKALFYGETVDPKHSVVERVRTAVDLEAARLEHTQFAARLAALEEAYRHADEDFYCAQIDALRRATGRSDSPLDQALGLDAPRSSNGGE